MANIGTPIWIHLLANTLVPAQIKLTMVNGIFWMVSVNTKTILMIT